MSFVDPPIPLSERDSMQHKSVPLLIKGADDHSGLSQSPRQRPPVGLTDTGRILRTDRSPTWGNGSPRPSNPLFRATFDRCRYGPSSCPVPVQIRPRSPG